MREISITKEEAGQRLDKFLGKYFRAATASFLYKMLRKKNIVLNQKRAEGRELLSEGDRIQVFFSDETFERMRGGDHQDQAFFALKEIDYRHVHVIYEDEDILALDKPAGCLSQRAGQKDMSLNEEMLAYLIAEGALTRESYFLFHPSVANRLDRNTSGLILAGKTLRGQQYLSDQLRDRSVIKLYHTIVRGRLTEELQLDGYLYKDVSRNQVLVSEKKEDLPEGAQEIHTAYRPLDHGKDLTLLEVHLMTGRSHQIRAHLASIGHPIAGDPKYGDFHWNQILRRKYGVRCQLLHSYSIKLLDGREIICPEGEIYRRVLSGQDGCTRDGTLKNRKSQT